MYENMLMQSIFLPMHTRVFYLSVVIVDALQSYVTFYCVNYFVLGVVVVVLVCN